MAIITVSRQIGSGGDLIALKVAENWDMNMSTTGW